jgi:hypothetical protein
MAIQAKFKIERIIRYDASAEVEMIPVVSDNADNEALFAWAPYAKISLGLMSLDEADKLDSGKTYTVTIAED